MSQESIDCRYCGCRRTRVDKTSTYETSFRGKDRTVIRRSRVCMNCGLRFTTVETLEDEDKIGVPETENFINLQVVEKTKARNPLEELQDDTPAPLAPVPQTFIGRLGIPVEGFNPMIHTSPKKEDGPLRGPDRETSLGKKQGKKQARKS